MAEPVAYNIIVAPGGEPVVFAGPPQRLTGRVELRNRSDVDVVLRDAVLNDTGKVFTMRPLRQSISALVLRPYEERCLPLTLAIDPTTPPGEYRAELELAGQCRAAVLHVTEVLDLTVRPQSVVVLNRLGQPQRKRVVITNDGNVGFPIGDIGDVDLEDDLLASRSSRVVLELSNKVAQQDADKLRIAREGAYVEAGMSVRKVGSRLDLAPGETKAIDLDITLQKELRENTRYRGRVSLCTRDLEIVVVPSTDRSPAPKPASEPANRIGSETGGRAATKRQGGRR